MIGPDQIRATRALLRLEQQQLANQARVSATTIRRIEAAAGGAAELVMTVMGRQ